MNGHSFLNISNNWLLHTVSHLFTKSVSCRSVKFTTGVFECMVRLKKFTLKKILSAVKTSNYISVKFQHPSRNTNTEINYCRYFSIKLRTIAQTETAHILPYISYIFILGQVAQAKRCFGYGLGNPGSIPGADAWRFLFTSWCPDWPLCSLSLL